MTITLGSFTSTKLLAQPFEYVGEARQGLTIRAFRIGGLLTPTQWQALTSEYNTWRNARINDPDTLQSQTVGTTVSLSIANANGLSITSLACWFDQPPSGQQTGQYISAEAVLVDAAQALAVLLRQRALDKERTKAEAADVDCTVIAANMQRQKADADCEIAALGTGLADDFAEQAIQRTKLEAVAKATAETAATTDLAAIKGAEATSELRDLQARYTGRASKAADIEAANLDLEMQAAQAKATAYAASTSDLQAVKAAEYDVETLQSAANVAALNSGGRLAAVKTARALQSVVDKYIAEDLPDLGTLTFGSCTVTLTAPPESRRDGPQVQLGATGASVITGPLVAHRSRTVRGYISSGTYDNLLTWYDTTVAAIPTTGTWFPVDAPQAEAEPFLIGGVKSTRYNVTLALVEVR